MRGKGKLEGVKVTRVSGTVSVRVEDKEVFVGRSSGNEKDEGEDRTRRGL